MVETFPQQGIDGAGAAVHADAMNPRHGLIAGAATAALVAVVLATVPVAWLADMLEVADGDATAFLFRRYAASATAALAVLTIAVGRRTDPHRAVLLGLSTWFGAQAVTAWWGVISGTVGGLAWLAVVADPLIAACFLILSRRRPVSPQATDRNAAR
jgi:hypothetical protein